MRVLSDDVVVGDERGSVVTVGVFDGVHLGHQAVLARVVAVAHEKFLTPSVVTFHPHPSRVIDPSRAPLALETLPRRLARLELLGIEQVRVINFDDAVARESAQDFVDRVLVGEMRARHVIVGEDFRFGHERGGDVDLLREWGATRGFSVEALASFGDAQRFSSTAARAHVLRGDLDGAERVLGHHVVVTGEVVHGDGRGGAELGYPTANLAIDPDYVQPGEGVYAAAARRANKRWYAAAVSIGQRPQFYVHGETTLEAYLVDFEGDLYGETLELVFLAYLRGEAKFDTVNDLVARIRHDVALTRRVFGNFAGKHESLLGFSLVQRR